jgi:predicted transcriptional regulator
MKTMPIASLTTRIDLDLKTELEQIARYEKRSASFLTIQAITNLVDERRATRELIETGLDLVKSGVSGVSSEQIHEWFMAEEDTPFPQASTQK